jgi:thioredoxin 1
MDSIEKKYSKQVKVVFHDVWTEAGAPYGQKYGIESIPTQVFLDANGKEYFRHVGFFPEEDVVTVLKMKGVN